MRGTGIDAGSSVIGVTAEDAEGRRGKGPTVHAPLQLQSSASSASSAVKLLLFLHAPTTIRRRHTNASRAAKREDPSLPKSFKNVVDLEERADDGAGPGRRPCSSLH